jgi:xanthosine utilization system XapX-like protein
MSRWIQLALLVASPIAISIGIVFLGWFIHAIGNAFGSRRSPAPIVLAMIGLTLLHAGYYLAPMLWVTERRTLGFWLLVPALVVAAVSWVYFAGRLIGGLEPRPDHTSDLLWIAGLLAAAVAYVGPPIVMLGRGTR